MQKIQSLKSPKLKRSHTRSASYPSVTASFKPPYHPNSPMMNSYKRNKKQKPLSTVFTVNNNNIVINLPPDVPLQGYSLNINLKLNS
jgi:hypothetical protein